MAGKASAYILIAAIAAGAGLGAIVLGGCMPASPGIGPDIEATARTTDACWGEDARLIPPLERVRHAAVRAVTDLEFLIPVALGSIFLIDDHDERLSDWAVGRTPLFGAEKGACDASNAMRAVLRGEAVATGIISTSGDSAGDSLYPKAKGFAVETAVFLAVDGATDLLKKESDRRRPNGHGDRSFPSGHSSQASCYGALASLSLDYVEMPAGARQAAKWANSALVYGTAWARIEGRKHYPSDVLFGIALGRVLTVFVFDAFLADTGAQIEVRSGEEGVGFSIEWKF